MQNAPTTVFIVDDAGSIRQRLGAMLAGLEGVRVVGEAATTAGAIKGILEKHPHVALLDLNLDVRTGGLDVLRAVRARAPEIIFVVLTNHAETQYRKACAKAGAAYFLDKTADFGRVPAVIAEIATTRH